MFIGILKIDWETNTSSYEEERLLEEIQRKGHKGEVSGQCKKTWDACIPRVKVLELNQKQKGSLEQAEIKVRLNATSAILCAKDKSCTTLALKKAKVPQPTTIVIRHAKELKGASKKVKGYPLIMKDVFGSYGYGVMLLETERSARSVVDCLLQPWGKMNKIIIQEWVKSGNKDTRLFVVRGKVVAAMSRTAQKGEFRSNAELGGECKAVKPTQKQIELALRATQALGLDVAGVDMLNSKEGPVVIEVNANPGFKALEKATGVNVAGAMIDALIEKHLQSC